MLWMEPSYTEIHFLIRTVEQVLEDYTTANLQVIP